MSAPSRPRRATGGQSRSFVGAVVLSVVLCGLLAACGSDETDASRDDEGAASEEGAEATSDSSLTTASTATAPPTTVTTTAPTTAPSTATTTAPSTASTTAPTPVTTVAPASSETTSVPFDGALGGPIDAPEQTVALRFESKVGDVTTEQLAAEALAVLNDERGWPRSGFRFVANSASPFRVVLAEGSEVDALCLPLRTYGTVSCQNGPVVALNADRWRGAVEHWDAEVSDYRGYLINHEVGHLLGQRHPKPRCPVAGKPAGVMEQQTAGLEGCTGNAWPREWEIDFASRRPVVYAPLPDWGPDPVPANGEA